jgi:hypothetical protein
MYFVFLIYFAAILLELIGSYMSIVGISEKTNFLFVFIILVFDFSKLVIVSALYKYWKEISVVLKLILIPSVFLLITVTSVSTYSYLMQELNKTTVVMEQSKLKIRDLENEKNRLVLRKADIDKQVSQLPADFVGQRKKMYDLFSNEITYLNTRIIEIEHELPELNKEMLSGGVHSGTIINIANAYDMDTKDVNKIFSLLMVFLIDPLVISLLILANFLFLKHYSQENKNNAFSEKHYDLFPFLNETDINQRKKDQVDKDVEKNNFSGVISDEFFKKFDENILPENLFEKKQDDFIIKKPDVYHGKSQDVVFEQEHVKPVMSNCPESIYQS